MKFSVFFLNFSMHFSSEKSVLCIFHNLLLKLKLYYLRIIHTNTAATTTTTTGINLSWLTIIVFRKEANFEPRCKFLSDKPKFFTSFR